MGLVLRSGDGATTITVGVRALTVSRQLVGSPFTSRKHCTLQYSPPDISGSAQSTGRQSIQLVDQGSTNGTFVNGVRVAEFSLQVGDTVVFGFGKAALGAALSGNPPPNQVYHVELATIGARRRPLACCMMFCWLSTGVLCVQRPRHHQHRLAPSARWRCGRLRARCAGCVRSIASASGKPPACCVCAHCGDLSLSTGGHMPSRSRAGAASVRTSWSLAVMPSCRPLAFTAL